MTRKRSTLPLKKWSMIILLPKSPFTERFRFWVVSKAAARTIWERLGRSKNRKNLKRQNKKMLQLRSLYLQVREVMQIKIPQIISCLRSSKSSDKKSTKRSKTLFTNWVLACACFGIRFLRCPFCFRFSVCSSCLRSSAIQRVKVTARFMARLASRSIRLAISATQRSDARPLR